MTQRRGLCEMARTHRKQATTMELTGKQHETEPSIYGNNQTTPNNLLSLRTLRAATTTFGVVSVSENRVYHLADGSRFVGRTINIVHWDGACKGSGSELVLPNVVLVNEKSCNLHSPTGPLGLRVSPCGLLMDSLSTPAGLLVDSR